MRKAIAKRRTVLAGVVALLASTVGVLTVTAAPVSATTRSVATESDFRTELTNLSGDPSGPHVINITASFTLTLAGDPTYNNLTQPLTINGNGHTINGGSAHRILYHDTTQQLTVNNLTLTNGDGQSFGGGPSTRGAR